MDIHKAQYVIGSRNPEPADQASPVRRTLTSRYYPEWIRRVIRDRKMAHFNRLCVNDRL
jgi:hypothetical protein